MIDRARQNQHHLIAAILKRLEHRHGVGDAAVQTRDSIDDIRLAEQRQGARTLEDVILILFQAALAEIDGLTGARVARADIKFGGVMRQRLVINRVFALAAGQRGKHIIQIDIVAGLEPVL